MNVIREGNSPQLVDTVVVGGGQAGLAMGYYLALHNRDFVILDAQNRVGDAWRQRWDSLRLFTPAKYDGLPGLPISGDRLGFPAKDDVADYLEAYAAHFHLPVSTGVRVDRLWRDGDRYVVAAGEREWRAAHVVVATGGSQVPTVPSFAAGLAPSVVQLHSAAYRNPAQLRPGAVLVVGVGNSGAEIALELSRTHRTWIAGRPSGEIPVRHGRMAARFALPVVRFVGLHVLNLRTPIGRRVAPRFLAHASPLIRTKVKDLAAAGVEFVPRVVGAENGSPVVDGGRILDVANVIWCTGYRGDFGWMDLPIFDDQGRPVYYRGVASAVSGVYFLGQEFQFAAVSATLVGLRRDAKYLAEKIEAAAPAKAVRRQPSPIGVS
jgi:putative flavoprotein involved in K+ transport